MRRRHFEALQPICPVCRSRAQSSHRLTLAKVVREDNGHIIEGALHCSNADCLREYPIIDGIPLIVSNIRQYVSDNVLGIYARGDLTEFTESLLGDCCGPGSRFDQTRQQLSSYAWDHYGDLDPNEPPADPPPGSMLRGLTLAHQMAEEVPPVTALLPSELPPPGPWIEVGCSVGRGSLALAGWSNELVLGVDLNFPMLRLAAETLRTGVVRYPKRQVGLVYDRHEFRVRFANSDAVDFWACDAAALPFPEQTFSRAVGMNMLDCIYAPRDFLDSLAAVLKPGGRAILGCPYDWSVTATPIEAWLGGHSQRSSAAGSSEAAVRTLLTPGENPASIAGLALVAERASVPWTVRLHERSTLFYRLHLMVAVRRSIKREATLPL